MASTSASGIGSAARTAVWARSGLAALLALPLIGAASPGQVEVSLAGLRSQNGMIRACMTLRADIFPDCEADPAARRLNVSAATPGPLRFADVPSGAYAVALIHDENGNGKLDTALGIPREGFGFSRNPRILFGPPRFSAAEFRVVGGDSAQAVKVRYLL